MRPDPTDDEGRCPPSSIAGVRDSVELRYTSELRSNAWSRPESRTMICHSLKNRHLGCVAVQVTSVEARLHGSSQNWVMRRSVTCNTSIMHIYMWFDRARLRDGRFGLLVVQMPSTRQTWSVLQRLDALVYRCNAQAQIFPAAFNGRSVWLLSRY